MTTRSAMLAVTALAALMMSPVSASAKSILEIAQSDAQFSTLVAAIKAAGLDDDLAKVSSVTVFAPTNAAFDKLPKGTLEGLLKPENKEKLRTILTYHLLSSKVFAKDVPHSPTLVSTLNGLPVTAVRQGTAVRINASRVVAANVEADNGVIHVVDSVLLPGTNPPVRRH